LAWNSIDAVHACPSARGAAEVTDVVVIGAGISGAAAAWELAASGVDVMLIDRYGPAAMGSGWTLAGVRQSGRAAVELPLARAAVALWADLAERLDAPTQYRRSGNLRLARTEAQLRDLRAMVDEQSRAGLELFLLDQDALRGLAPCVSHEVLGASYCPSDGHADPLATVTGFVAAAKREGAVTRFGEAVQAIEVTGGRVTGVRTERKRIACGRVVLAAGVLGNALLAPHGLHVPMEPRGVTVLRTAPVPPVLAQVIGVADATCAGRQEVDGRFRFTGRGEPWTGGLDWTDALAGPDGRAGPRLLPATGEVARVAGLFGALVPATLAAPLDEVWLGLIDQTPDALPVIEACEVPDGLILAMGFSGHGFCLGPVTGRILAALARGETPDLPIGPFALGRFQSARARFAPATLHG
jgi:sarcosine oxidase, subunit beta